MDNLNVRLLTKILSCLGALFVAGGVSIPTSSWGQGNHSPVVEPNLVVENEGRERETKRAELRRLSQEIERRLGKGTRYITLVTPESSLRDYAQAFGRAIEQQGTHDFPKREGVPVYGSVLMSVTVNAKGLVEGAELLEGSDRFLEAHARKLLKDVMGAPFPPDFPPGTQRIVFSTPFDYRRE